MDLSNGDDSGDVKLHESEMGGGETLEPYVGMEFDSEDEARNFYVDYARRLGFVVRMMQRRRSGIDGRTLARRLGCNKQGFSPNSQKSAHLGGEKRPRHSSREGCKATILVKMEKSGKWVVTRFIKEHNHPLFLTASPYNTVLADKDKQIEELEREIGHQNQLCEAYRDRLLSLMNNVEQHTEELSSRIRDIAENVKKIESELQIHNIRT
ncbi:PREDICTED: protein FAR1-RELATED SEQUENCE 5-like [Tarenaya hassleriana]|uniref:protein FAR1-RELATED SEQUENCE 5-like n=1 Tax=Tarenaya hassleriana TaxID=28532 RepID=UPI00053C67A9|nr:PREDICTED: protein FAR1-RELATED SEQUENCE 5-like [Tarenaya hassleriana]